MHINMLEPKECFGWFARISQFPRGTGNEKALSDFLVQFAKERNLFVVQDAACNVIIKKPGTSGMENVPAVILQGHMDMVCVKEDGHTINFTTDPIQLLVEGDTIRADKTSLGADNGIAIAFMLALLDSTDIAHPPLEVVMTAQEEVGLVGASQCDTSLLTGSFFINLDSEKEGVFCVSCAGGRRSKLALPVERIPMTDIAHAQEYTFITLTVGGLLGGHSGIDIHKERGNSNRLLARVLATLNDRFDMFLSHIQGGIAANAIPRESTAVVCVRATLHEVAQQLEVLQSTFANELRAADGAGLVLSATKASQAATVFSKETLRKVLMASFLLPHGVIAMDLNMKEQSLVESSNNFALLETTPEAIHFHCASRSSLSSKKEFIFQQIKMVADAVGAELSASGDYPAWEYNANSVLREVFQQAFTALHGKKAHTEGIHAGLECGIFYEKLKAQGNAVDCIAFGPTICDAHTPQESLSRVSTENAWKLLKAVLLLLGKKASE